MLWKPFTEWRERQEAKRMGKRRLPKAPFIPRFETLEARVVPSVDLSMPARPSGLEGTIGNGHDLAWFGSATGGMSRLAVAHQANVTTSGSLAIDESGEYDLGVTISGTNSIGSFTFSVTATISFHYTATASWSNGHYTFTTSGWQDSTVIHYHFQQMVGTQVVRDESGSDQFDWSEAGGSALAGLQGNAFNWVGPTLQVSALHNFYLNNATWSTFAATETGDSSYTLHETGSESYSASGQRSTDGGGTPGWSGYETYTLSGSGNYVWDETATEHFVLSEQGSYGGGSFVLSAATFDATGTTTDSYKETGSITETGTGTGTGQQTGSTSYGSDYQSNQNFANNTASNYTFTNSDAYQYSEITASTYSLHEHGSYNGAFTLDVVIYDELGHGSYSFAEQTTSAWSGSNNSQNSAGRTGQGGWTIGGWTTTGSDLGSATGSQTYNFSGTDNTTYALTGDGNYHLHEVGSFSGGQYSFSSVVFTLTGEDSYTSTEIGTDTWNGTTSSSSSSSFGFGANGSYGGDSGNGQTTASQSGSDSSTFGGNDAWQSNGAGSDSYSLQEVGSFADGQYTFTSVVYSLTGTDTWTYAAAGSETWAGSGSQTIDQSWTNSGASSYGPTSGTNQSSRTYHDASSYSYLGAFAFQDDEKGSDNYTLSESGSYANGNLHFDSVVYNETGNSTVSYASAGSESRSESGETVISTTTSGTGSGTDLDGNSFSGTSSTATVSTNDYSLLSNMSFSYAYAGASSYTLHEVGSADNGTFTFPLVQYAAQSAGSSHYVEAGESIRDKTNTTASTGNSTSSSTTGSNTVNWTSNSATLDVATSHSDVTYNHVADSSGTDDYHEEGQYANGTYTLVHFTDNAAGSDSTTYSENGTGTSQDVYTSTTVSQSTGPGLSSSQTDSTSNTYNNSFTDVYTVVGSDAWTQYEAGGWQNGDWRIDTVNYAESGSETKSLSENGTATWTGVTTVSGNWTASTGYITTTVSKDSTDNNSGTDVYASTNGTIVNFSLAETGSYAAGQWTFTSAVYDISGTPTNSYNDHVTASVNGTAETTTTEVGSDWASQDITDSAYAVTTVSISTGNGSGTWSQHEEGSFANGQWTISNAVYNQSGTDNSQFQQTVASSETDSGSTTESDQTGSTVTAWSSTDQFNASYATASTVTGTLYEHGTFGNNQWTLDVVNYSTNGDRSYQYADSDNSTYLSSTTAPTYTETDISADSSSYQSSGSDSYSENGTGTYQDGNYHYSMIVSQGQAASQFAGHDQGSETTTHVEGGYITITVTTGTETGDGTDAQQWSYTGSFDQGHFTWFNSSYQETTADEYVLRDQGTTTKSGPNFNSISVFTYDESGSDGSTLNEVGNFSNGYWSFTAYGFSEFSEASSVYSETGDSTATANIGDGGVGGGYDGQTVTTWVHWTVSDHATLSFQHQETGTSSGSNYNYTSYTLDRSNTDDYTYHEDGSTSTGAWWTETNHTDSSNDHQEQGQGTAGTYTDDTSSSSTHYFDASWEGPDNSSQSGSSENSGGLQLARLGGTSIGLIAGLGQGVGSSVTTLGQGGAFDYTLDQVKMNLQKNPEAAALLDQAEKDGYKIRFGSVRRGSGGAQINLYNKVITIDPLIATDIDSATAGLLFELLRYKHRQEQYDLDDKVKAGTLTKEQYALESEILTWKYTKEHHKIAEPMVPKKWSRKTDPFKADLNFQEFLEQSKKTGHYKSAEESYDDLIKQRPGFWDAVLEGFWIGAGPISSAMKFWP